MKTLFAKAIKVVLYPRDYLILFLTHFRTKFLSLGRRKVKEKTKLEDSRNFEPRMVCLRNSGVEKRFASKQRGISQNLYMYALFAQKGQNFTTHFKKRF